MVKYFFGKFIDVPSLTTVRIRDNTLITVDDNGTILDIVENYNFNLLPIGTHILQNKNLHSTTTAKVDGGKITNDGQKNPIEFYFPGFIDTHIHASQYPNCGLFGNSTLLDWLNTFTFPLEESFNNLDYAEEIYVRLVEKTLSFGTTTASYFATLHLDATKLLAKICLDMNQRSFVGKLCMNQNSPDYYIESNTKESIGNTIELIDFIENELTNQNQTQKSDRNNGQKVDQLVKPIITPRFAPSCTNELLYELGKLSKLTDLPIQTHLSENIDEINWVKDLFPQYENYTDVYYQNGLLTDKTVLAHCIHLNDDEIDLIKSQKSGIAHCPISNTCLSSGECPIRKLLNHNINIGLGTDVSAGYNCNILDTARHAHMVSRHLAMKQKNSIDKDNIKLSITECLYLATMGGAKVLSLQDKIGSFEIGKKFDTLLINLNNVDFFFNQQNDTSFLEKWFFNGDDRNVTKVWVNGKMSMDKSKTK